ncbi:MAG: protease pro-enzyme activation domain-containing protein, partial [Candidatus Sulfotelmatobacter sp.]
VQAGPRSSGNEAVQQNSAPRLITQEIDETRLVTLAGNTRREANAKNDRGKLPDSFSIEHMTLLFQYVPEREQALNEFIAQLHDKNSPNFHKWIDATEFGERFGLSIKDIDTASAWLKSHGFTVNGVSANRMTIDFSGNAGQVRRAFHTEMHSLGVRGETHYANMSDPRIPQALTAAVRGVVALNDFRPHQMKRAKKQGRLSKPGVNPDFTFGPNCGFLTGLRDGSPNCEALMPQDLETIYNINPLLSAGITGKGQTIAVVEDEDPYSLGDWSTFRKTAGLARAYPYGTVALTHPGGCADSTDKNDTTDDEVAIDMEWASAAAPNAAIQVAVCKSVLTAIQNIVNGAAPYPNTVSISYGESEAQNGASTNAAYNTAYATGVTEGISIFVSSGDEGACSGNADGADCTKGITVSGFTSTPNNISVGGTDFGDAYAGTESTYWNSGNTASYGSAKSYIPEIPWNDSCADSLIINFLNTYYSSSLTNGYGPSGTGICNTYPWNVSTSLLTTGSGSGGPSNCATGSATTSGDPASGGTCAGYAKPSWQAGAVLGNPSDGVRDIPDVSLMAANGVWNHFYMICMSNPAEVSEGYAEPCSDPVQDWPGFGGTSVSSPIWAGIQALVNQYTNSNWGNANTVYYKIANTEYGGSGNANCNSNLGNAVGASCTFYDVTKGSIYLPCTVSSSNATTGRLYNCYRDSTATNATADYGVMSAAPETFPGAGGPGPVTDLNITNSNGGTTAYTSAPTCALTGGAGSGATCTTSISGLVTAIAKGASGSGYATAPNCTITGGGGLGATCSTTLTGSSVNTVVLQNGGSGYTSTPACSLSGGGGSGATCSVTESTGVTGITLTAGGSGYTSNPTCTLTGGGGSPAATCGSWINGVTSLAPQTYPATVGWDFATGIGTVNAYNLVMNPAW